MRRDSTPQSAIVYPQDIDGYAERLHYKSECGTAYQVGCNRQQERHKYVMGEIGEAFHPGIMLWRGDKPKDDPFQNGPWQSGGIAFCV